jgi:HEPN domain-containing protein
VLSHRDIARALLIEAYADLEAARALRQAGVHARCMAHCQHTVEKALKAILAVRDVIITDRHDVSEDFRQAYADWSLCGELADIAVTMESIGFRTEYPLFGRRDLPVWIPSEQYTGLDADKALRKATRVFEAVESYLVSKHDIQWQTQGEGGTGDRRLDTP